MKSNFLAGAFLASTLLVATASSETAKINIYSDASGSSCELVDVVDPPVVFVYFFYSGPPATAVRFKAPKPSCWTGATFAGDSSPYVGAGNSQFDWSIGFGICKGGSFYIGRTAYLVTGGLAHCCQLSALPAGEFAYTDCNFGESPLSAGQNLVINPDASCRCNQPLATEPSTWGRVKSLYR